MKMKTNPNHPQFDITGINPADLIFKITSLSPGVTLSRETVGRAFDALREKQRDEQMGGQALWRSVYIQTPGTKKAPSLPLRGLGITYALDCGNLRDPETGTTISLPSRMWIKEDGGKLTLTLDVFSPLQGKIPDMVTECRQIEASPAPVLQKTVAAAPQILDNGYVR